MVEKAASGRTLLALTYDQNGNQVRQTDVMGKVTEHTYSPLDLLEKVWDDGGEVAAYDYNPDGIVKSLVHGWQITCIRMMAMATERENIS